MTSSSISSRSDAFRPALAVVVDPSDDLADDLADDLTGGMADDMVATLSEDGSGLREAARRRLASHVRAQLELLGEDPMREGLSRTPERAARSLAYLTSGYRQSVASVIGEGVFPEEHDGMVMVRDIEFYSLCEHHLLPFHGRAHVAYVPDGRILGLSKVARIVDVFARRFQVQERLTDQVADAIQGALAPRGVGVVMEAEHLCMMMRGVQKQGARTVTSALRGCFLHDARTRDEFLRLAHG